MPAIIISETSCLILFEKIGELKLLKRLFGEITTTKIVANEFGKNLPNWNKIQNPIDLTCQLVLQSSLVVGEASAIALALERKDFLLIIDELKGRKLATGLGLTITGTLGVLVQAKKMVTFYYLNRY